MAGYKVWMLPLGTVVPLEISLSSSYIRFFSNLWFCDVIRKIYILVKICDMLVAHEKKILGWNQLLIPEPWELHHLKEICISLIGSQYSWELALVSKTTTLVTDSITHSMSLYWSSCAPASCWALSYQTHLFLILAQVFLLQELMRFVVSNSRGCQ